ncbi:MAG TPA: cytochrome c biogenesis protein CcdA [Rhodothermales bacterium]|nr:cytochrome c biogenesis protein CcdA [Rhodothermales bacterium]
MTSARQFGMRWLAGLFTGLLWLIVGAAAVHAQGPATDYVEWSSEIEPAEVALGGSATLHLHADIADGWHMYALDSPPPTKALKVELDPLAPGITAAPFEQTTPEQGFDPNFGLTVRYFERQADLSTTVAVSQTAVPGEHAISGKILFMICNDRMCLPPTHVPLSVPFTVTGSAKPLAALEPALRSDSTTAAAPPNGGPAQGDAAPADPDQAAVGPTSGFPAAGGDLGRARAGGLWAFILLAVGAGLGALLTPCVFPMIPLTVSFFTRHADDHRSAAVRMAGVYGFAIVLTFTGLGLLMALLLGAAGAQTVAANPWLNLFIGVVFIVFALSLLGLFELRLPQGLVNYFNRQGNERPGYLGVLFMGLTLTLVSFSCTAPFVGGLLAATVQGERFYPIVGMLVFSLTFALPFVLFALFPRALHSLPRSGAWLNAVKVVLGFVELAAALKFLSNADLLWGWGIISRTLAIAVTVVIFFLAGLYLLGKLPLEHEELPQRVGVGRLLFSIAFFGVALYMIPGLLGAPLNKLDAYLPPRQATDVNLLSALASTGHPGTTADGEEWHVDDIDAAFAAAAQQNKPVLIDFTGYTCTNCREMEANVFTRPDVLQRFGRDFVLLRLYTDGLEHGEDFQRYQLKTTGTVALPTYAIVDPSGKRLIARITGLTEAEDFLAFLDTGAARYQQQILAANTP